MVNAISYIATKDTKKYIYFNYIPPRVYCSSHSDHLSNCYHHLSVAGEGTLPKASSFVSTKSLKNKILLRNHTAYIVDIINLQKALWLFFLQISVCSFVCVTVYIKRNIAYGILALVFVLGTFQMVSGRQNSSSFVCIRVHGSHFAKIRTFSCVSEQTHNIEWSFLRNTFHVPVKVKSELPCTQYFVVFHATLTMPGLLCCIEGFISAVHEQGEVLRRNNKTKCVYVHKCIHVAFI